MEKRKLLIATDSFLPRWDGIARFLSEIIPKLAETYELTILAPEFPGRLDKLPAKIIRFPLYKQKFGDISFCKPEIKKIKEEIKKTDLVWTQTIGPIGIPTIFYANRYEKPTTAYIHSIDWELTSNAVKRFQGLTRFVTKTVAKYLYNRCDLLLVPSAEIAEIIKQNGISTLKSIIHLGTNTEKFKPTEDIAESKRRVEIDPDNIVIGYCGRIGREKDLKTLYRAYARLQEKMHNLKLLLVGSGVEEQEEFFKEKKGVILTGSKNNVIPYLQAMDIYVLPSLTETTSLSTMEAMAVGLPVITTKLDALKAYINPNKNGLFFPKKNSYVLRIKLEKILENPYLAKTLGANARQTIINKYSWEKTVEDIGKALSAI